MKPDPSSGPGREPYGQKAWLALTWKGWHAVFCPPVKVTLTGTPSARSVSCSPAGSVAWRKVTLMLPPACRVTVQAANRTRGALADSLADGGLTAGGLTAGWPAGNATPTATAAAAAAPTAAATPETRRRTRTARPRVMICSTGVVITTVPR